MTQRFCVIFRIKKWKKMLRNYSLKSSNMNKHDEKTITQWKCLENNQKFVCKSRHVNLCSKSFKNAYEGVHF